jgi:hypothetical protein
MDQDIHFQKPAAFAAGALTTFFQVPYRCTLREIKGIVQADPGDDETITVTGGATAATATIALGVLTFGNTIAAGAVGAWVPDATTGGTVLEEGSFLKFVTSAAAVAAVDTDIELDPYAR